ncbi:hypothetical protein BATDEDRAFT_87722 [Batrachochytrium dendrobatidis JAM81]|uniref:Uncharacterized protein n=1 Tax=Batrachochytrium dendrobatidis (strain JAM81 / FGSC 10211) TaxID=684364 RepID=F4P003_BATDJ|nr:uncharacterized protein BATDEDRAFT_87722 [Batrachochytrium dendrobatidis JAM81]EGF81488.1 hypothetical protein BATDEDRAFT_87722 [Batrachochytrium dendrobatidis JAM81]|eukprot:XP_006678222.1 hypothetical protein BATDEDRAFT_87722 [Batrachochytrium dendrobatidis JAM81]
MSFIPSVSQNSLASCIPDALKKLPKKYYSHQLNISKIPALPSRLDSVERRRGSNKSSRITQITKRQSRVTQLIRTKKAIKSKLQSATSQGLYQRRSLERFSSECSKLQ